MIPGRGRMRCRIRIIIPASHYSFMELQANRSNRTPGRQKGQREMMRERERVKFGTCEIIAKQTLGLRTGSAFTIQLDTPFIILRSLPLCHFRTGNNQYTRETLGARTSFICIYTFEIRIYSIERRAKGLLVIRIHRTYNSGLLSPPNDPLLFIVCRFQFSSRSTAKGAVTIRNRLYSAREFIAKHSNGH